MVNQLAAPGEPRVGAVRVVPLWASPSAAQDIGHRLPLGSTWSLCPSSAMRHFTILGWLWLVFGTLGSFFECWAVVVAVHFIYSAGFYRVGRFGALVNELPSCVFTLAAIVAGYGLLRRWRWARVAIEVLGAILLVMSVIALFSPVTIGQRIVFLGPVALFAMYSLIVALFVKYEGRPA